MSDIQFNAGVALIKYLKQKYYPKAKISGHREFYANDCPGKNFPLTKFKLL